MGKLKKLIVSALLLCFSIIGAFCASITYVYGNNISSLDVESDYKVGQLFTDSNSNTLAIKRFYQTDDGRVAVFDKLISRGPYKRNDVLSPRGAMNSFGAIGAMSHSLAWWSMTTPIYPLSPLVMAGACYGPDSGVGVLALAGAKVNIPIARLWDAQNTLIVNGKLSGWGAAGVSISSSVTFACSFGFSYRHNLGSFFWELGASWLWIPDRTRTLSPYLGLGVDF